MTTLTCDELTTERPRRRIAWRHLLVALPRYLLRAQQRRRDRMALLTMSTEMLRDIGIDRFEAERAAMDITIWR